MATRRKGREIALAILYQSEWDAIEDVEGVLSEYAEHLTSETIPERETALAFARSRLEGVLAHRGELDQLLGKFTKRWRLDRMAKVDKNILRLGAYELCYCPEIPPKVAINEAVELAKRFGSEESSAFVNGILDAILRSREEERKGAP